MATNRTPQEALDFAKRIIGNAPLDDAALKFRVLQDTSDYIHMAAPWRWSVRALVETPIVNAQDEYTIADAADILYILRGELRYADGNREFMRPVHSLAAGGIITGTPKEIMLLDTTTLQINPIPSFLTGEEPVLIAHGKLRNTNITAGNVSAAATLLFDDEYFHVFQAGVLAHAFMFTDNQRLGAITTAGQNVQFSGQWGVFQGLLQQMIGREKPMTMELGAPVNG